MRSTKTTLTSALAIAVLAVSSSGVMAQEGEPPSEFNGRLEFGPGLGTATEVQADGKTESRGGAFRTPVAAMSDARLDGTWTRTNNIDFYDDPQVWTWQANWRVVTDEGAWEGIETPLVFADGSRTTTTTFLVGEGAYDGLVAITEFDLEGQGWDLRGVVIDGEVPPPPESAAAE